ncbi:MAG: T9SS type A sorting domain-containing protein, partial [Ignavibacteria bacterium]
MKKLCTISFMILYVLIFSDTSQASLPSFNATVKNVTFGDTLGGSHNVMYFDIYLLHTNPEVSIPFSLFGAEIILSFNPIIANGGTLNLKNIGSELPPSNPPGFSNIIGDVLRTEITYLSYPGPAVSSIFPGTKVMRLRLATSALTFAAVPFDLRWRLPGEGGYTTIIGAYDEDGLAHDITSNGTFEIEYNEPYPRLVSPADKSLNERIIKFVWYKFEKAERYSLLISDDSLMSHFVFYDSLITDTSKLITTLNFGTKYFWKIKARDSLNILISSVTRLFSTKPVLISPANDTTNTITTINFKWNKFYSYASDYTLKVSTDAAQNSIVYLDSTINDTSRVVTGLSTDQKYYWSVSSKDSANIFYSSPVWNFSTISILVFPVEGMFVSSGLDFFWRSVTGATKYLLQISNTNLFTTILYKDSTTTETSVIVNFNFIPFATYYWRILVGNAGGYFMTSNVRSFMGDFALPVELASFTSDISSNNVKLNWSTVSEENNSGFDIERQLATHSDVWDKAGFVEGKGNSVTQTEYLFEDKNLNSGKYRYRLKQIDYNGNYKYYPLTGEVLIDTPDKFSLSQNYPNPFNPNTIINFQLPEMARVSLIVYDNTGREVAVLINETRQAGYYQKSFNGSSLSSGIYYYSLILNEGNAYTKKIDNHTPYGLKPFLEQRRQRTRYQLTGLATKAIDADNAFAIY